MPLAFSPFVPITHRPALPDDATALAQVYAAYDVIEFGQPEMELSDIESMLAVEDSDRFVVEDGELVGFVDLAANGEVETLVDPSYAGAKDMQGELLTWAVKRARERGIARLEHWSGTLPTSAAPVLTAAGFEPARTMWRMHRDLGGELPVAVCQFFTSSLMAMK